MQGVVNQHETGAQPTAAEQSGYSGLGGLLKTVSQKIPQPSSAANYLAGISGITQGAQPTQPEPADKPTLTSMLTSWAASFSAGSSTGMSDQQRLRDIKSRKLQLQKLVSQLEGSERAIIDRNASPKTPTPENSEPTSAHTDASEFEDDAVMVGQPSNDAASGSRTQSKSADSTKNSSDKKSSATGSTSSRRWFW
ncbi:hypothetical protein GGF43_001931 [Coemansia sp. RSA 2618]|nr:hypothetical protein GGF43_001931 [Coemansia sp. RSA 2618]